MKYPLSKFGVYNPPDAHYSHVKLDKNEKKHIAKIIGRAGENFKWITSVSRVQYIWFREDQDLIEIWGPESSHVTAKRMMRELIDRVMKKHLRPEE
jgi:hypothetical protein